MSATKNGIQSGKSSQKKQPSPGGRAARLYFRKLENLIELPDSLAAEQAANGRLLVVFSWLNIIVMLLLLVAVLIVAPKRVMRPLVIVVPVNALFLIVISLIKRGKVLLASYLMVGMLWLMVTVYALSGGGAKAPSYVGYFVVTFLAGILIGGPAVFIMTVICGLSGLGMVYLESIGWLPVAQYQHSSLTYWIGVFAFMLIVAFLQYYTSQVAKRALRQAHEELSERIRTEDSLQQKSRSLYMLSNCNQALVYISDEHRLLQEMCRICVEDGGYRMAWVGFAENDPEKTVRPAAQFGFDDEYLASAQITWADTERGRGPTGRAIRSGQPCVTRNFLTDPQALPWRDAAIQRGYASSIALPLIIDDTTIGAFMLYDRKPDAFTPDEIKLLVELSMDMA